MIVVAIIALSTVVLSLLFILFESIPVITDSTFWTYVQYVLPHIVRGVKFVNALMYPQVVWPLAGVCLAMHAFYVSYRCVLWILKKVPMFGISD